jgi:hypothetical protein
MSSQMSPITFSCECGQKLLAKPDQMGQVFSCPHCGAHVTVPFLTAPPSINKSSHEDAMINPQISPTNLSPQDGCTAWKARIPLILSSFACVFSLLAFAGIFFRSDPLGKGLDAYDFGTPNTALISQLKIEVNKDIRAGIDLAQIRVGELTKEKLNTIKVHKESTYRGQKLLFVSFEENGISQYTVEGFEKHAETGWWLPSFISTYDIDDDELKTAIEQWQAKSGKIAPGD